LTHLCNKSDVNSLSPVITTTNELYYLSGLTMDEHHISPIENLDNTINSLYSYLSGSEGEADMPRPHRLAPHRNPGGVYDRRRADPSPCASSSRSSYESEHDRSHDHAGSCNEGESHYSRINDAGNAAFWVTRLSG